MIPPESEPESAPLPPALHQLLETSTDALFVLDAGGRFVYANASAAAVVGLEPAGLLGLSLEEDLPHAFSEQWRPASRRAREEGRSAEYDTFNPALGRWVRVRVVPDGGGVAVQMRDITALRQTAALQQVTAALGEVEDPQRVTDVMLRYAVSATGAYMGAILGPVPGESGMLELQGAVNYPPELQERFRRVPVTLGIPPCEAAQTREAVFVSGAEFDTRYPESVGVRAKQTRSLASLPVMLEGELWGVLALSFREARRFGESEREFLQALVAQCGQTLERTTAQRRQREQAETLATLNRIGQSLSAELDLNRLVQLVTDAGVELTGAQFGAFFYNVRSEQESYTLYTLSGAPREAFAAFPMPRKTAIFGPTFEGAGIIRSSDITRDPRYGHNAPFRGMPAGHLPVRSYLAVPVVSRSGEVLGGLFFGHAEPGVFTGHAERLASGLAAQTAVALDNSRLYGQLQDSHALLERRVEDRTAELAEQKAALEAFVRFTESAGSSTDVYTLARQALTVFGSFFAGCSAAYYECDGEWWHARVWTPDLAPEVIRSITSGVPVDAPAFSEARASRAPVFVNGWDAEQQQVAATDEYGTVALYPMMVAGQVAGMLAVGLRGVQRWSESAQGVVRSVGRSLNLALERAEVSAQLETQRDALQARTRALEAFAQLTRDLTLEADPLALIRRAGEIVLSLLPEGYALYWEPEDDLWRARVQVGDLRHAGLQRQVDAGFPYRETRTIRLPFETGAPLYQDEYDRQGDNLEGTVSHISTTASLPVRVGGEVQGVLVVGLFGQRGWTPTDRALLDTVMRSVSLSLEGAQKARALQQRTVELERSNAELERFAYVASHDLQEPLRTIASFTGLIGHRYSGQLDEQGRKYLGLVTQGAERMKVLIDDLLVFSRLNAVREPLRPLPLEEPLQEALDRLQGAVEASGARVTRGALPVVLGLHPELVQLFQNLLGNALKFRRAGTVPQVHVTADWEEEAWHVQVRDNGIGFEPQYAERIFQIFQRLNLREQYEGTGMGLAIVRKIVEHHGGRAWAESVPGEGSTFHFTLQGHGEEPGEAQRGPDH